MSLVIKKHPAERFIDWMYTHTKLYIRGAKGASWEKSHILHKELFDQLVPFFDKIIQETKEEK